METEPTEGERKRENAWGERLEKMRELAKHIYAKKTRTLPEPDYAFAAECMIQAEFRGLAANRREVEALEKALANGWWVWMLRLQCSWQMNRLS